MVHPCAGCGAFILTGKFARTDEGYYHPSCFVCCECGVSVLNEYFYHEHRLYCRSDFARLCCPTCPACDNKITGKFIQALNKRFHPECFRCGVCQVQLSDAFFHSGDVILCHEHHDHACTPTNALRQSLSPAGPEVAPLVSPATAPSAASTAAPPAHPPPPRPHPVAVPPTNRQIQLLVTSQSSAPSTAPSSLASTSVRTMSTAVSTRSSSSVPLKERRAFKEDLSVKPTSVAGAPPTTSAKRKLAEAFQGMALLTPATATPKTAKVHLEGSPLDVALHAAAGNAEGSTSNNDTITRKPSDRADGALEVDLVVIDVDGQRMVKAGSIDALIERLITVSDTDYFSTFLLTYRSFMTPTDLLETIIKRYRDCDGKLESHHVRLRVLNVCRAWVDNHFEQDLLGNERLLGAMQGFLRVVHTANQREQGNIALVIEKKILEQRITFEKTNPAQRHLAASGAVGLHGKSPKPILSRKIRGGSFGFLDVDPLELARQMTLIESGFFNAIRPMECLNQAWNTKDKDKLAPYMSAMIARFNGTSFALATLVCDEPVLSKRVAIVKHMIKLAENLRELNNYNGVMEVVTGLQMASVYRLRRTWKGVSKRRKQSLQRMNDLLASQGSFKELRTALRTCNPPCVPYLGMYLTDLTFIEDGNPSKTSDGLVNFQKRALLAKVIRELQLYQQPYNFDSVPQIRDFILDLKVLDSNSLYDLSLQIEPRDGAKMAAQPDDDPMDVSESGEESRPRSSNNDGDDDDAASDVDMEQIETYQKRRSRQMTVEDILAADSMIHREPPSATPLQDETGSKRIGRFLDTYKKTF